MVLTDFRVRGKSYAEGKASASELAKDIQDYIVEYSLSWAEIAKISQTLGRIV